MAGIGICTSKRMRAMRRPVRSLPCVQCVRIGALVGLENSLKACNMIRAELGQRGR